MPVFNDVHQQFAEYFKAPALKPYLYLLSRKMSEGHICIGGEDLEQDILPESYRLLALSLKEIENHALVTNGNEYKPFVLSGGKLYLQRYFTYESRLLAKILELTGRSAKHAAERMQQLRGMKDLIKPLFANHTTNPDWQLIAALVALVQDFSIITGGPGTGKTTTVARILTLLFTMEPSLKVALAAPTGKAAARMADSLSHVPTVTSDEVKASFAKLKPSTIHRLLGWQPGTPYFRHDAEHPLPYDLLIVDESSMLDIALFSKLMQAVGEGTRVLLLGDKDQLASVEAGSLFGDLCNAIKPLNGFDAGWRSFINGLTAMNALADTAAENQNHPLFQHIVALQHSHRFDGDKGIGKLSKAILQHKTDELIRFTEGQTDDDVIIDTHYDEQVFLNFIKGYKAIIASNAAFDEAAIIRSLQQLNDLRILCAVREGAQGVYQMNASVEAYLKKKGYIRLNDVFYEHRPVMVTRNNYTLGLYNGDTGILRKDENNIMKAWFLQNNEDGSVSLRSVLPGFISHMETVYAMTIHKSQGSEFKNVLIVLPKQETDILTRELVYTAVTRAREKVIIQVTQETLLKAVSVQVQRGSGIIDRLTKAGASL